VAVGIASSMRMIRPGFLSPAERRELVACVRGQREDHGIVRRANVILLLNGGKSCQAIAEFFYLDDDTIRSWYKTYREARFDNTAYHTGPDVRKFLKRPYCRI